MSTRLRELRDRLGYSQEGMATSVGMAQRTYANWEKQPPEALTHLASLSRHYGVSADYLLGIIDDPAGRRDLAADELETLRLWEALDGSQRRLVLDTMRMLLRASTPHIIGGEEGEGGEGS